MNPEDVSKILRACYLATQAHKDQKRKYTNDLGYWNKLLYERGFILMKMKEGENDKNLQEQ